jgi:hypothetical protein
MADALGDYLKTIGRIPLLTDAEEVHLGSLVRQWQDAAEQTSSVVRRGRRAHTRMVNANLRLVVTIVSRYARRSQHLNQDSMDLIQAGNIGLIRAVEKFIPPGATSFRPMVIGGLSKLWVVTCMSTAAPSAFRSV